MDILKLHDDKFFIDDVQKFFERNSFEYFDPHHKTSFRKEIADAILDTYFGVYQDGIMVAYGFFRGLDEGYETPMLGIGVDESYRGLGIGRLLMTFLETEARVRGYQNMLLRVHRENKYAVNFYLSLEYSIINDTDEYLVMQKEL